MTHDAQEGLLLIISGPSGVGKSTLIERLNRKFDFVFSVSATTRERTAKETDEIEYFSDEPTFMDWIEEGHSSNTPTCSAVLVRHPRDAVQQQLDSPHRDPRHPVGRRRVRSRCGRWGSYPPSSEEAHRLSASVTRPR